jgi:mycothiol synthase
VRHPATPVRIRPAGLADHPVAQAICQASLPLEPDAADLPVILLGETATSAGTALDETTDPARTARDETTDPARVALVAELDGAVAGVACGSLRRDQPLGYVDLLAVLPAARRRGVGAALLAATEQALAARGAIGFRLAGNPPVYLWPGVDTRYEAMAALADRAGYQRFAEAVNLAVDLAPGPPGDDPLDTQADERRLAREGITVRRPAAADAGPLTAWLRQGPWGDSAWPDEVARSLGHTPPACHIAERDGHYLAFAAHSANRRGWFGPMGTLDAERRRGLGAVLLKRCLADIRASGLASAQIGWTGPVEFYEHAVAARLDRHFHLYRKDAC